jgi:hypothetical protein
MKILRRSPVLALIVLFSWCLVAFRLFQPANPEDLTAILTWLAAGPGAVWVAGRALSFLLEQIPAWGTAISGQLRWWIVLVLSGGLMFGAYTLLQQSEVVLQLSPIYQMLFMLVAAWLGSQQQFVTLVMAGRITGLTGTKLRTD